MSDPIIEASTKGWIAEHRQQYLTDPKAGHLWDSTFAGGPGPLPTLLLTTVGAKSGQASVMPLLYDVVNGAYAIVASKGGAPKHPGWYHNLLAQTIVTVQVGSEIFKAAARVTSGAERAKVWTQMAAMYPPYTAYQTKTPREIPVVLLERIA